MTGKKKGQGNDWDVDWKGKVITEKKTERASWWLGGRWKERGNDWGKERDWEDGKGNAMTRR